MNVIIFLLNLMITAAIAHYKHVTVSVDNYDTYAAVFHQYINTTYATKTNGRNYKNKGYCIKLCYQLKCLAIDVEADGNEVICYFYYQYQTLFSSEGTFHISRKSPSSRYCSAFENLCGECECYDTIDALDPYFCDCRQHLLMDLNLTRGCNTTGLQLLDVPSIYNITFSEGFHLDVICEANQNISYQLLMARTYSSQSTPKIFPSLKDMNFGFKDTNMYWIGFSNLHLLTNIYNYNFVIEFWDVALTHFIVQYENFKMLEDLSISYEKFGMILGPINNIFPNNVSPIGQCVGGEPYRWANCDSSKSFFNQDQPYWGTLQLRKVKLLLKRYQATTLLSQGKTATASSTYSSDFRSDYAFDGDLRHGIFFHSKRELEPWLQVDVINVFHIYSIKVYNRNTERGRMQRVKLLVSYEEDMTNDKRICNTFEKMKSLIEMYYCFNNLRGRYVRISMGPFITITDRYLQVAEMQVYGY